MTSYSTRIRPRVQAELDAAASAEAHGHFPTAFQHLQRAHVIGQPSTLQHVRAHWRMFRFALRNRRRGEAYGQAWRLVAAAVFTPAGLVPTGNTGGADVSGLHRMAIPEDLQAAINSARREQPHCGAGASAPCSCAQCGGQARTRRDARSCIAATRFEAPAFSCGCASCSCS